LALDKEFVSIGNERLDRLMRGVVSIFETAFPARVRAYYVEGSHADGTELTTSDLDCTFIFHGAFCDETERSTAHAIGEYCAAISPIELDIEVKDEAELAAGVPPTLKLGGRLIYGDDMRETLPLIAIEDWTRDRMHASYWLLVKVFGRPPKVSYPLGYPDPAGEFYSYDSRRVQLPDGSAVNSTRNLIPVTGWMATALIALQARQFVARKRDCHMLYRQWIGDEWASLLEEIYTLCRDQWSYLMPQTAEDRKRLRGICARTLEFENHFLMRYKPFLLAELGSDTPGSERARWLMDQIPFDDAEIRAATQNHLDVE
jgi:hypothetical protein